MKKPSKKISKKQGPKPVSLSIERCEDSLKNLCGRGSPFAAEIDARAKTITPLLKEILDFRPRPHWH